MKIISTKPTPKNAEWRKCAANPAYFIETYVKLRSTLNTVTDFALYPHQAEYLKQLHSRDSTISAQCRGAGSTVTTIAFLLWESIFTPGVTIHISSGNHGQTMNMYDMYVYARNALPSFLQPKLDRCSMTIIELENGSKVHFQTLSHHSFVGISSDRIFVDGLGYVSEPIQQAIIANLFRLRSQQTKLLINSLPTNKNNSYAHLWRAVESGSLPGMSTFKRTVHDMQIFSGTQLGIMAMVGTETFQRDYECDFDA